MTDKINEISKRAASAYMNAVNQRLVDSKANDHEQDNIWRMIPQIRVEKPENNQSGPVISLNIAENEQAWGKGENDESMRPINGRNTLDYNDTFRIGDKLFQYLGINSQNDPIVVEIKKEQK